MTPEQFADLLFVVTEIRSRSASFSSYFVAACVFFGFALGFRAGSGVGGREL